ncbi:MAG: GWxTD domain-containing protein [Candidatus Zixiibacteriota bacterium]|nr:MAG: GWxTD domain-containing protein [candidate division Zixibacteria bacterium]
MNSSIIRDTAVMSFLVLLICGPATAQPPLWESPNQEPSLSVHVDRADFNSESEGKVKLEIYYKVYNVGLKFVETDGVWRAHYEVSAVVRDDDGRQVVASSKDRSVTVDNEGKTRSRYDYRSSQINFDLDPGKYKVEFTLLDVKSRESTRREFDFKAELRDRRQPSMSGIEFAQSVNQLTDSSSVFRKGNLQVVPSVSRVFGGTEDSRLLFYMEVYTGSDNADRVVVETRLRHERKGMVYRDTLHVDLNEPVTRHLRQMSVSDYPAGGYELEVYLRGRRNKKLAELKEPFELLLSQEALIRADWDQVTGQLSYIADPGEADNMKQLTSFEARQAAFDEFWLRRDPTVGSVENEAKDEFYRRISIANRRFSSLMYDGWRSDRGRIYIIYGAPDSVDDFPYAAHTVAYQVWHYYTQGRYRRFTFVDEQEDGDYRLQYPYDGLHQQPDF